MPDINSAAREVFEILQSFDYTVILYDEEGNSVAEPADARRMFARPQNMLVSIVDDGDNSSIRLFVGKKTQVSDILGLIDTLRTAAGKWNLLFNVRRYNKEITPKGFSSNHAVTEDAERLGNYIIENLKCRLNKLGNIPGSKIGKFND